ncbi:MAG: DNA adenine methylase [Lachnospiraceae bacterium]
MRNPLRYPGAKSKLFDYVKALIENEGLRGCTFYEPFAGSATFSWQLLEDGIIKKCSYK